MTQQANLQAFLEEIAADINALLTRLGDITTLNTTDKTSAVAALNEVLQRAVDAAVIDDAVMALTTTWSSTKIDQEIASRTQAVQTLLLGGTPPALIDTIVEAANAIQGNDLDIDAILQGQAVRVGVDMNQGFSAVQKQQGRENIGAQSAAEIGDTNFDYAASYRALSNV